MDPRTTKCYPNCSYAPSTQVYHDYVQMICAGIGECSYDSKNKFQTYGNNATKKC